MSLAPGIRIGPHEILAPLGAGGMGEVYRALDTQLGREVAIKILSGAFADDPERMARFRREAQVLASLNHPNIAAIYGIENHALVMELVEGPTLAERIVQHPFPLDEALPLILQLIDALEYAHEKGVVHRDLKPANIKITPEGRLKVLDFGLAKALAGASDAPDPGSLPTLTLRTTMTGTIVGTAAYMAPEQARGQNVDQRADIWSFGVVVYEMLTGRRAFQGETASETIAAVLKEEPDFSLVPRPMRRLVQVCMRKDPRQRMRDIGDARILLEEPPATPTAIPTRGAVPQLLPWILLALVGTLLGFALWRATRPAERSLIRLAVDLGPSALPGTNVSVAMSPDGRQLAFPVRGPNGTQLLATRMLDQAQATPLPGAANGGDPFFSPDGEWLGFFAEGKLKKISVHGGGAVDLCPAVNPRGASWGEDGYIVAALNLSGPLVRVPAGGGPPQLLTKLPAKEVTHRWPQVLPGGNAVIFTASSNPIAQEDAEIKAMSLRTGEVKVVQRGGYYGRYLPSGHLVYVHQGALHGVKFNAMRLETQGSPAPLLDDVAGNPLTGGGQFDFSAAPSGPGAFVYSAGQSAAQSWLLSGLDDSGKMQPLLAMPGPYVLPRFSPDGRKLSFGGPGGDLYVYDLDREITTRLTFSGSVGGAVWAPDGKHIALGSGHAISWIRSDGAGEPKTLLDVQGSSGAWSFSPDGRWLAYFESKPDTGADIWVLPLDVSDPDHPKPGKPISFLATPADELLPRFSADGRWIAYRSDESGGNQIYVRPFPAGSGGKWQISTDGGLYAFWSKNGRELFYETLDHRIMVTDYSVDGSSFIPGKPRLWSDRQIFYPGVSNMDLAPDGKRFAVLALPEAMGSAHNSVHVTMLLNFFDELKRRLP